MASIIHADLAGPLPTTAEGFNWILGVADNFSGYIRAIGIKDKKHPTIVEALSNAWINQIGSPDQIICDNEFRSQEMTNLCLSQPISQNTIPPYNPC